jgi:hypothetical protein
MRATKSFRVFAGTLGLTTSRYGVEATSVSGTKSFTGSYLTLGYAAGAITWVLVVPIVNV